jgi:hypothetical protein
MIRSTLLFGILLVSSVAHADSARAKSSLDMLRSWKGAWTLVDAGKTLPIKMSYDEASRGNVVTEQFGRELSVFFIDGDALIMTHYCNRGNIPRLKLNDASTVDHLEFEQVDVANLATATTPHVHKVIYSRVNTKMIELELVWQNPNGETSEKYTLKRR